jgi:hypothetical protein
MDQEPIHTCHEAGWDIPTADLQRLITHILYSGPAALIPDPIGRFALDDTLSLGQLLCL